MNEPESTREPRPPGFEEKSALTDVVIPLAIAGTAGFGNGLGRAAGEAVADRFRTPKAPPEKK